MTQLIRLDDIYKIYGSGDSEVRALNGVSLNIYDGEFVAIIGSSGSGKSTLMNTMTAGRPARGTYLLDGTNVKHLG